MSSSDVGLPEVVVKDGFYIKKVKIYLEHKTSSCFLLALLQFILHLGSKVSNLSTPFPDLNASVLAVLYRSEIPYSAWHFKFSGSDACIPNLVLSPLFWHTTKRQQFILLNSSPYYYSDSPLPFSWLA